MGIRKDHDVARLSLQTAIQLYLEALYEAGVPESTRGVYGSTVNRLGIRLHGRQFAGITTADLAVFLHGPKGVAVGKAPSTVANHRAALRSFFAYGQGQGWRKDVPAAPRPIVNSSKRHETRLPTRLTADQLVLLLHATDEPVLRGMLAIGMNTALRVSDIRKIQVRDINLATMELSILTQKTGLADALPITLDLERELRTYLTWYTGETGRTVRDANAYIFPGWVTVRGRIASEREPDTDRRISYEWARKRLLGLYAACGVDVESREVWHTIRRSVGRIYFDSLRSDISFDHALRQTAALLGHKSTTQTEVYLGLDAEIAARNESLRGKRLIIPGGNVVRLHRETG